MPYWEAGASLSPYSRGYFPATCGAMLAWVYEAPDEEAGVHHGFDSGGFASGEGDGGGGGDVGGF